jgi:hypothetical protein
MAITIKNAAADLLTALAGQTLAGVLLTEDDNLFKRAIYPVPMGLVAVLRNSGGTAPVPYLNPTASAYFAPTVQCLVYGMPGADGYDSAEALARAVLGYLHQGSVTGYVSVFARDSQPTYVGLDEDTERHVFSINLEVQYRA